MLTDCAFSSKWSISRILTEASWTPAVQWLSYSLYTSEQMMKTNILLVSFWSLLLLLFHSVVVREGCINCGTEDECTCFIFSVWTAPGQGLISNLPLCLLFLISLPAWPQLCLFLYLPTSDFLLHAYTLVFSLNPLCSTSQTLSWFLFCCLSSLSMLLWLSLCSPVLLQS